MRKMRINSEVLLLLIYKITLDVTYSQIQTDLFGYYGFTCEFDVFRAIVGFFLYMFTFLSIMEEESDTSILFLYVIFMISIAPFITLYQYDDRVKFWMVFSQSLLLVGMKWILTVGKKIKFGMGEIKGVNYKNKIFRLVVSAIIFLYFGSSLIQFGLPNLNSLLFEEVYNTRGAISLSTFQSIFQNIMCRIVCPLSILVCFKEKKWFMFTLLLIIQVYTYAVTGFKTYLFIPLVLIALQFVPKFDLKKTIVMGLPLGLIALVIMYLFTESVMLYAVIGNRVFFLPAKIKYAYFDYFSVNEYVYFSQNTISKILGVKSNYSTRIPNLIGEVYFNKPSMWTNTGFMADAYANLGYLGMVLMGGLLCLILIILQKQLKKVPEHMQKVLQAIFVIFYISLNDGATISILFSGGLLFAVCMVCFVKFVDNHPKGNQQ